MKWLSVFKSKRVKKDYGSASHEQPAGGPDGSAGSYSSSRQGCRKSLEAWRQARQARTSCDLHSHITTTEKLSVLKAGVTTLINDTYLVVKHLGSGTFGQVKLAFHLHQRKLYAIKACRRSQLSALLPPPLSPQGGSAETAPRRSWRTAARRLSLRARRSVSVPNSATAANSISPPSSWSLPLQHSSFLPPTAPPPAAAATQPPVAAAATAFSIPPTTAFAFGAGQSTAAPAVPFFGVPQASGANTGWNPASFALPGLSVNTAGPKHGSNRSSASQCATAYSVPEGGSPHGTASDASESESMHNTTSSQSLSMQELGCSKAPDVCTVHLRAEELLREIAVMKKLSHPHIVQLVEVIDDPSSDHLLLVMEYVEGVTLHPTQLGPGVWQPLPEQQIWSHIRDVLQGLDYLHYHGVVHGDLKPANLMLDANSGHVKIVDFGSAVFQQHAQNGLPSGSAAAAAGSLSCTPAFRSPESLQRGYRPGPELDMWALGVSIYLWAFGMLPFKGSAPFQVYDNIRKQPLTLPATPRISNELADFLRALLNKDVSQRISATGGLSHPWVTGNGLAPLASYEDSSAFTFRRTLTQEELDCAIVASCSGTGTAQMLELVMQEVTIPAQSLMIRSGDPADCVYLILRGEVEILQDVNESSEGSTDQRCADGQLQGVSLGSSPNNQPIIDGLTLDRLGGYESDEEQLLGSSTRLGDFLASAQCNLPDHSGGSDRAPGNPWQRSVSQYPGPTQSSPSRPQQVLLAIKGPGDSLGLGGIGTRAKMQFNTPEIASSPLPHRPFNLQDSQQLQQHLRDGRSAIIPHQEAHPATNNQAGSHAWHQHTANPHNQGPTCPNPHTIHPLGDSMQPQSSHQHTIPPCNPPTSQLHNPFHPTNQSSNYPAIHPDSNDRISSSQHQVPALGHQTQPPCPPGSHHFLPHVAMQPAPQYSGTVQHGITSQSNSIRLGGQSFGSSHCQPNQPMISNQPHSSHHVGHGGHTTDSNSNRRGSLGQQPKPTWHANVRARTDVTALCACVEQLQELVKLHPDVASAVEQMCSQQETDLAVAEAMRQLTLSATQQLARIII